jgi:hypothetical protein
VNKLIAILAVKILSFDTCAIGYSIAMRTAASLVLANVEVTGMWRESDSQINSIRYAKIIQLVGSKQDGLAINQACKELSRSIKNIRAIHEMLHEKDSSAPRVPEISEKTYASSCK